MYIRSYIKKRSICSHNARYLCQKNYKLTDIHDQENKIIYESVSDTKIIADTEILSNSGSTIETGIESNYEFKSKLMPATYLNRFKNITDNLKNIDVKNSVADLNNKITSIKTHIHNLPEIPTLSVTSTLSKFSKISDTFV